MYTSNPKNTIKPSATAETAQQMTAAAIAFLDTLEPTQRRQVVFSIEDNERTCWDYRLHGPSFLVEYDNNQNDANHIHSVWRDLKRDWGDDLLKKHYASAHQTTPSSQGATN